MFIFICFHVILCNSIDFGYRRMDQPTDAGAVLGHFFGMAENTNTTEASLSYTTEQQQLSTSSPQK